MSRRGRRGGPRSEEDRQRARLEREQRRARREGRPIPESVEDLAQPGAAAPYEDLGFEPSGEAFDAGAPHPSGFEVAEPAGTEPAAAVPSPAAGHGHEPGSGDPAAPAPTEPWWTQDPDPGQPAGPATPEQRPDGVDWFQSAAPRVTAPEDVGTPVALPPVAPEPPAASPPPAAAPAPAAATPPPPAAARPPVTVPPRAAAPPPAAPPSDQHLDDDEFDHDPPPSPPARRAAVAAGKPPATVVGQRTAPARRGVSRIAALLVLFVIALLLVAAYVVFEPFKGDGSGRVAVVIPPGSSVDDIGKLLEKKGVISHAAVFSLRARISGAGGALRAGTVEMKHDMSYGAAIDALQKDPLPPPVIRVSIPEGLSRRETAAVVRKAGIRGDYLSASARSRDFDPRRYGQPRRIKGLEGFLFPATYELQRGTATASSLVAEQVANFRKQIGSVSMRRARKAKLTRYDVLIIASMIEREVRVPAERRLVAAVIYNRLRTDMFLGIDATIRYAERNWSRPLRQSELDRPGPYNTRRTKGLPPTPIGNPGLASIQAAANPARSNAVYYVVRPCGNGRHNFSATAEGFARDQAYYEQERKRVGGDPADATGCKRR